MNIKRHFFFLICLIFTNSMSKGQSTILAINSTSKTVAQLNAADGTLINASFMSLGSLNPGTIKGIIQVQNKFWISDQTNNVIYVYNSDGTYSSTIPSSTGLSNIRGLNIVNNEVWVTNAGNSNGATANSIVRLDFTGNNIGIFPTLGSPFDVLDNGAGSVYITSFNSDGIQTMSYNGTVTGNLVQSGVLSGVQQINKIQNGNYLVGVFSSNTSAGNDPGVYVISSANGNILNKWTVGGVRGVIQTGNGNYLYTTGSGVYTLNPSTGATAQVISGNYQYMKLINTSVLNVTEAKESISASVYPNPTSGVLFVKSDKKINNVSVYSVAGQMVKNFRDTDINENKINISDLLPGTYLIRVETKSGQKTLKVVKK